MTTDSDKTAAETTPPDPTAAKPETPAQTAPASPESAQSSGQPVQAAQAIARPADGARPKRGLIGWLNFYAEDLLAPISKPRHQCARCKRKMWRGYFLSMSTNVQGVSDMQIVCWRCKLAAAQLEIEKLRTTGRR
jgi:hypothetical protein